MRTIDEARLGARLFPHTFLDDPDLLNADRRLRTWARGGCSGDHAFARWLGSLDSGRWSATLWAARWAGLGCPQVVVGHKLAASLMATATPAEVAEGLELPFPAFVIAVPEHLLQIPAPGRPDVLHEIGFVCVLSSDEGLALFLRNRGDDQFLLLKTARNWGEAIEGLDAEDELELLPGGTAVDDVHRRATALVVRLVIGVALEMIDPERVRRPKTTDGKTKSIKKRGEEAPTLLTYTLVRDVVVDCREAVREHLSGRRSGKLSVQVLVRGHWKRHAFGPGRQQRRVIHVEPYWRGPEDAPIAVRSHQIREKP